VNSYGSGYWIPSGGFGMRFQGGHCKGHQKMLPIGSNRIGSGVETTEEATRTIRLRR